jgi:hypothetical protein
VLIAEHLMLLCIDPQNGEFDTSRSHVDIDTLAAAALMLDLTEQHRLRFNVGYVAIQTSLPITHPQLAATARTLAGTGHGLLLDAAVDLLVSRLAPVSRHLLESLFRRDVLHRARTSWRPWSPLRYPLRSLQARNEAVTQLHKGASEKVASLRGLGLLVLTDFAGRLTANLAANAHETAALKLLELSSEPVGENAEHDMLVHLRRSLLN